MSAFNRLPQSLPDLPESLTFAGVTCLLVGDGQRSLAIVLEPGQAISINPLALLWKDEAARLFGEPNGAVLVQGPGRVGLALGLAGSIFPLPLHRDETIQVQSGRFLFSAGIERRANVVRGLADRLAGSSGATLDTFRAGPEGGVVWVQGGGSVLERNLAEGEVLDIRSDAFLAKDSSVSLDALLAAGEGFSWPCLRLTGPGRLALQIAPAHEVALAMANVDAKSPRARGMKFDFPFSARR
jgi:uncharacterized protein (AIM24 family)